jgi:hypothetical protein
MHTASFLMGPDDFLHPHQAHQISPLEFIELFADMMDGLLN